MTSRTRLGALLAVFMLAFAPIIPAYADGDDPWPGIAKDLFAGRTVEDTTQIVLDAPYRAEDAGIVPISVKIPADLAGKVSRLTLVIDKNPMPVVATFSFGAAAGTGDREISTRVRFDMYSNLRAIAETTDGKLLMVSRFVKAAGGCSAPAQKDADQALAALDRRAPGPQRAARPCPSVQDAAAHPRASPRPQARPALAGAPCEHRDLTFSACRP